MVKIVVVVDKDTKEWFDGDIEVLDEVSIGGTTPAVFNLQVKDKKTDKIIASFQSPKWLYWREVKE